MTEDWWHLARCKGEDRELFFRDTAQAQREAKAICRRCPAQVPCLEEGMDERHGIWGGLSPDERKQARLRRAARRRSA